MKDIDLTPVARVFTRIVASLPYAIGIPLAVVAGATVLAGIVAFALVAKGLVIGAGILIGSWLIQWMGPEWILGIAAKLAAIAAG